MNLARVHFREGRLEDAARALARARDAERAAYHRAAHERHRTDDLAVATAVARHRAANPPANHAAEAITLYDLQRGVCVVTDAGSSERRPEQGIDGAEVDTIASCTEQDIERQEAGRP